MAVMWFRRLGLQRRIMLYVTIGLGLMLAIGVYLGIIAIRQATQLIYQERVGIASVITTTMELNLQEAVREVTSEGVRLLSSSSAEQREEIGGDLFQHLSVLSPFPFVRARALYLLDGDGQIRMAFPRSATAADGLYPKMTLPNVKEPTLLAPVPSPEETRFGTLLVPLEDAAAMPGRMAVVELMGLNGSDPYLIIPPSGAAQEPAAPQAASSAYRMEVLGPGGIVALTRGGRTPIGHISAHYLLTQQQAPESGTTSVFLHRPKKGQTFAPHVIATRPLSLGGYKVLLEQSEDVALALPLRLRQRLILFAGAGFVLTMVVAWVTTRHVVKPTEQLTLAAQRIAEGQVDTPILVAAQDEIGTLAESLETMRLRLHAWGSELEKQVQERTARLEEVLRKVISAQEEERYRLARELHDETSQTLGALSIALERAEDGLQGAAPEPLEQIRQARAITVRLLEETRRLILDLRPTVLDDLGLEPAIRWYVETHLEEQGVAAVVEVDHPTPRLPKYIEVALYRVVQEAVNNITKHANAKHAHVRLAFPDSTVSVVITDDGRGFDVDQVVGPDRPVKSVGILGMQERVGLLNGRIQIRSQEGKGSEVSIEIPIAEEPA